MDRGSFIKVAALTVGGLALGRLPKAPVPLTPVSMTVTYLDQGVLDLGIVRDSVLTSPGGFCPPGYQLFAETFENAAMVRGLELPRVTASAP